MNNENLEIDNALEVIKNDLQNYLTQLPELKVQSNKDVVHITSVVDQKGAIAIDKDNLGLMLVNIEEERVLKSQRSVIVDSNNKVSHVNPEIKLNLYILISANFSTYTMGVQHLSGVIRFFQSKSVFNHQNSPGLYPNIQKLIVELYSLNFEQQNHLWASLGAKYLPSVLYKVRMLSIQEAQKIDEQPPIKIIDSSEKEI